ncbi:MAG: hypothetical protein HKO79_03910 [Desulfobacterales bacterium]|nr:hypothetical protein [Deltaproteobacteria bacterium]NNL41614.1 hypothetical protein [Desulfobacterales bacterium]
MLEGNPKPVIIKLIDGTKARGTIFVFEGKRISDIIKNADKFIVLYNTSIAGLRDKTAILNKAQILYIIPED